MPARTTGGKPRNGADRPLQRFAYFFSAALPFGFLRTTGFGPGSTTASPPAFLIFSSAEALNLWAVIFNFLLSSPLPRTFSASQGRLQIPAALSDSSVTS